MQPGKVLIVGGGIAGMSLAIGLRRDGWAVDIVESDPEWRVYGAGITITGATFRAFETLGLLEELHARGFCSTGAGVVCSLKGDKIADLPMPPLAPGLPTVGGIMRPILHEMLSSRTRTSGANVRLGVTLESWTETGDRATAITSDGKTADYDLIVGADGAFSSVRAKLFPQAPQPAYTGQFCWRVVADRPPEIDRVHFFVGGRDTGGVTPVSEGKLYMFVLETQAEKVRVPPEEMEARLRAVMVPFGGLMGRIRDGLGPDSQINCRPLEAVLTPAPWWAGRVILIGDAAHATTPHLASGAGISVEDAIVLGQCLNSEPSVEAAFTRFMERRWERCRMLVENSVAIGKLQQGNGSPQELNHLMEVSQRELRNEI